MRLLNWWGNRGRERRSHCPEFSSTNRLIRDLNPSLLEAVLSATRPGAFQSALVWGPNLGRNSSAESALQPQHTP